MKRFIPLWLILLFIVAMPSQASLVVLSYHDVDQGPSNATNTESMSVTTRELTEQFSWLKANGYHVVSIADLIAANEGRKPLPEKAVLLTFDDGYLSMYQRVYPLLKLFNYPAVLAIMGQWIETPASEMVAYGNESIARGHFLTWPQIKEMVDSGFVEIASHSYDLHHGELANPQGNVQPAAVTHNYTPAEKQYESDTEYQARIYTDLQRSAALIKAKTGVAPRVMVWPYGAYNQTTLNLAKKLGMPITMSLDKGQTDINDLSNIHRILVGNYADIADFVWLMNYHIKQTIDPIRVIHVDLDYVYDPSPAQQDKNLDILLERIKAMGISTVYLQAFADPDGDGNANALYFPNRHLPMRADLFNRVSWQLRTRSGVDVYAWMPVLSFDLPNNHPLLQHRVQATPARDNEDYRRLSPFSAEALTFVGDIYEDLARYTKFKGLIFHDDAYLNDHEDTSPFALAAYKRAGFPENIEIIKNNPILNSQWIRFKSEALVKWTDALTQRAALFQPKLKTARNMYASVIMNPEAEAWFAQSMALFLQHYDYTAIMAMPYMEKANNPEKWLISMIDKIKTYPGAIDKTVFELQSVNWETQQPIPATVLAKQMDVFLTHGAKHYGYYPDDFIEGQPELEIIRPSLSLTSIPEE